MRKRQILWAFFGVICLIFLYLAAAEGIPFLWIFPLASQGVIPWALICALDILFVRSGLPIVPLGRLLLWCGGLLFFTAYEGVPGVALALIVGGSLLWVAAKTGSRFLSGIAFLAVALASFGHGGSLLHPGMVGELSDLRFSIRLISAFALFRTLSWAVAVWARGANPSYLATMEYFISPAFWLSPMHASHLVFERMQPPAEEVPIERALSWIGRGALHSLLFALLVSRCMPYVQARFEAGFSHIAWPVWLALGPILFLASYLEKSRVSYLVAGCLSLTGHDVQPDFRSPWLARNLLDYWRRFHFWMWEYYIEMIYMPLAALLLRWLGARAALYCAVFLTFSVGTSLIHWVHYPAPAASAIALGTIFGLFTLLHLALKRWLQNPWLGRPFTWLSVSVLYILAYPAFGLGWGLEEFFGFLRR